MNKILLLKKELQLTQDEDIKKEIEDAIKEEEKTQDQLFKLTRIIK